MSKSACLTFGRAHVYKHASWVIRHRQILRHLGNDKRTHHACVGARLDNNRWPLFSAQTGRVGEADEDDVAAIRVFQRISLLFGQLNHGRFSTASHHLGPTPTTVPVPI
jgi:hypothetical protein